MPRLVKVLPDEDRAKVASCADPCYESKPSVAQTVQQPAEHLFQVTSYRRVNHLNSS